MRDAITDVPGIRVGHDTDLVGITGCTVILCEGGAVGGVDVRGSAPGTRETDLLDPTAHVQRVHAVLLTGGSAFGLDAAGGVMSHLAERGIGFDAGVARVPIVPAAVLFDLAIGSASAHPGADAGRRACVAATADGVIEGSVGAGTGATVGKLFGLAGAVKGGIGTASITLAGGIVVGALIAVNAFGDVVDPATGAVIAGARRGGRFVNTAATLPRLGLDANAARPGTNTTIGVVATNARLTKAQASKVAAMAQDGLALAVRPSHTMLDGDAVFALATGESDAAFDLSVLGVAAAEATARAIVRAVRQATTLGGVVAARDLEAGG